MDGPHLGWPVNKSVNVVAEISAELERERQKNAELMERISMLEAQIRERKMETQDNHQHAVARSFKKFKRQKIEMVADEVETINTVKSEVASHYKPNTEGIVHNEFSPVKRLINWMSMEDSQNLYLEKFKDSDSVADFNDTDSDYECDDNYDDDMDNSQSQRHEKIDDITGTVNAQKDHIDEESNVICLESFSGHRSDPAGNVRQEDHEKQKTSCRLLAQLSKKSEIKPHEGKEIKGTAGYTAPLEVPSSGSVRISQNIKPLKVAFCPKEVKRIIESEALLQKNAQSHTIRKIIVFASLGIRHGCEDMYELDFNHFSILKKGEPYMSPRNPGVREICLLVFSLQCHFPVVS